METEDLNHIALHVSNLEASNKFYGELLGLEKIKRPDFDFPGEWYRLGKSQELHLIAGRVDKVNSSTRGNHFALGVKNMDLTEVFLKDKGIFLTEEIIAAATAKSAAGSNNFIPPAIFKNMSILER